MTTSARWGAASVVPVPVVGAYAIRVRGDANQTKRAALSRRSSPRLTTRGPGPLILSRRTWRRARAVVACSRRADDAAPSVRSSPRTHAAAVRVAVCVYTRARLTSSPTSTLSTRPSLVAIFSPTRGPSCDVAPWRRDANRSTPP